MPQEIELKLSLPPNQQDTLRQSPLLKNYAGPPPVKRHLLNTYFDSPEQRLNQHGVALRIRHQGEEYIQTLKTRGQSRGGLHQRNEWEWRLAAPQLAPEKLPAEALPPGLNPSTLVPAFTTDFMRITWNLDFPFNGQSAQVELVLDVGEARADTLSDPISEIELELKDGPPEALFELAKQLAADVALRITRISKAERGYRLRHPERARNLPPASNRAVDATATLERLQAVMESYLFVDDPGLLQQLEQSLRALKDTAGFAPEALGDELRALHDALQRPDAERRQVVLKWINSRRLGLTLVTLAQALFEHRNDG
ncbi:inorganic triphosphatase [Motiliproteus sp. SC1-56]|uniref:CYTH domain-containing protein n=1 Tax=Motiliproteus sp. SC1-56 TaxID=2799565 RepID=UPI001A8DC910|nr:CYTH domain-containing protein [Motiliproteus sp. SC1-56]